MAIEKKRKLALIGISAAALVGVGVLVSSCAAASTENNEDNTNPGTPDTSNPTPGTPDTGTPKPPDVSTALFPTKPIPKQGAQLTSSEYTSLKSNPKDETLLNKVFDGMSKVKADYLNDLKVVVSDMVSNSAVVTIAYDSAVYGGWSDKTTGEVTSTLRIVANQENHAFPTTPQAIENPQVNLSTYGTYYLKPSKEVLSKIFTGIDSLSKDEYDSLVYSSQITKDGLVINLSLGSYYNSWNDKSTSAVTSKNLFSTQTLKSSQPYLVDNNAGTLTIQGLGSATITPTFSIPGTISDLPVVAIGEAAFSGAKIVNLSIPNSVISIGDRAFVNNTLKSLTLGNQVKTIGVLAFGNTVYNKPSNAISSLVIPSSVISVADDAFIDNMLNTLTLNEGLQYIGDRAFGNYDAYKRFNSINKLVIPNSVLKIGAEAFADNNLITIQLGNSLQWIGPGAFANTSAYTTNNQYSSIALPDSVTYIGAEAFVNNVMFTKLIANQAMADGMIFNQYHAISMGLDKIQNLSFTNSVTSIGDKAFYYFDKLTSLTLPTNLETIGVQAFTGGKLTSLTLPAKTQSIGKGAFMNNMLASVNLNQGLKSIAELAFSNNNLKTVVIPNSVTTVGSEAFDNDVTLSGWPKSLTHVLPPRNEEEEQ